MKTIVDQDIVRLIREYPLAWVVPQDHRVFPALLPMIAECDSVGAAVSLMGHVPKAHPLTAVFKNDGRTRFLFLGPHGYISPELLSNKDWAPTWNYAAAQIDAEVEIDDNLTGEALNALVEKMEQGRAAPWSVAALGDRYSLLESRVVGFRARILSVQAKFKLGQDEDPTAFSEIVDGLGDLELSSWMKCFRAAD